MLATPIVTTVLIELEIEQEFKFSPGSVFLTLETGSAIWILRVRVGVYGTAFIQSFFVQGHDAYNNLSDWESALSLR